MKFLELTTSERMQFSEDFAYFTPFTSEEVYDIMNYINPNLSKGKRYYVSLESIREVFHELLKRNLLIV